MQPELWRRPGIHDGHVAWIADATSGAGTELIVAPIATSAPQVIHQSDSVLTGLDFRGGAIGWIGSGAIGWADVTDVLHGDE